MRTEYSDRYITMGLKIAYYRKKAGYTQEAFARRLVKVLISFRKLKALAQSRVSPWKHCLKLQMFLASRPQSF